ncbi:hypothetical protein DACRYDRAFT_102219 [Dacryopinax primogenitus]|uniref:Arrestin-like N-terminal domain-containing protein n=1 Tax=Dacryopinax primogenitus (strain DJM 731) TaxID=1858805 RepID=M5FS49_DACPD|nr:uncharacterized protein DACRYDRAFT_102219 [Dacryopinax primogenitus]EJT97959.1 hypothetical protein DACRYDRAFT_102219 [Dacryopinax primogenitus]
MKLHGPSRTSTLSRRGSPTPLKPVSGASVSTPTSDLSSLRAQAVAAHGHSHPQTLHTYTLEQASFPYVTLALNSCAASSEQMPVFHGACPVTGEVVLEQSKLRSIKDVMITVEGRLFAPCGEATSFLSQTLSLITPAFPQPPPRTSTLDGTHSLPFSFTFPSVGSNGAPLPTSWASALSPNTKIEYIFSLRIKRKSRAARRVCGDDVLNVPIVFHPRVRPEKQPLVAWSAAGLVGEWPTDRSAWHLSTATIRGSELGQRDASLRATLGLAAPLAYPVRSYIPFTITLSDERNSAPDVLSAPIAISVDLRRGVRYVPTVIPHAVSVWCVSCGFASSKCICPKAALIKAAHANKPSQEWTWESVAVANCWQVPHSAANVRVVRGEIDLDGSLEPSFTFGGLSVSYAVHVRFSAPGREDEHFTFVEPVTLVPELGGETGSSRTSGYSSSTPSMTAGSSAYAPSIRSASPPSASSAAAAAIKAQHNALSKTLSYSPQPTSYHDLPPSYDCSQVQAGYGYGLGSTPSALKPAGRERGGKQSSPPGTPQSRASSEELELQLPVSAHSRAPCGAIRFGLKPGQPGQGETWMHMRVSEEDFLLA